MLIAALPLFLLFPGCTPGAVPAASPSPPELYPEHFYGSNALNEVSAFVNLGPRTAGSEGMRKASEHIAGRLRDIGLTPAVTAFTRDTPAGKLTLRNVSATLQGKGDNYIVLLSHADTKAGISDAFEGANDSGSSTGLLIALASHLRKNKIKLNYSIIFAFVDGEECRYRYGPRDGLHGSRQLAEKLKNSVKAENILGVIVIDMVGDRDLTIEIPPNGSSELTDAILHAAKKQGTSRYFCRGRQKVLDDHQPFLDAGIQAIVLIDFTYGSSPGRNNYWHTTEDTLDKLSAESLEITGRTILQFLTDRDSSSE